MGVGVEVGGELIGWGYVLCVGGFLGVAKLQPVAQRADKKGKGAGDGGI